LRTNERVMFEPCIKDSTSARLISLGAWYAGREALRNLEVDMEQAIKEIEAGIEKFKAAVREVQQFAAIPVAQFEKFGYADIFKMVLSFVDRLKVSWSDFERGKEFQELFNMLLFTASLKVIWGTSEECLKNAFHLWSMKEQAYDGHVDVWSEEARTDAIQKLFNLFDTDGGGAVDFSELKISFKGMGLDCDDNSAISAVKFFDENKDGVLGVTEFSKMLTQQIKFVFHQFVHHSTDHSEEAMIRASDLQSVAQKSLGVELTDEEAEKMITFLDSGDEQISMDEFEQLILMPPEAMVASGKQQNRAKRTTDGKASAPKKDALPVPVAALKNRKTLLTEFMTPAVGLSATAFEFSKQPSQRGQRATSLVSSKEDSQDNTTVNCSTVGAVTMNIELVG